MKILTVCSTLDFINFTRRATIEAIHKMNPDLEVLLFNSIKNLTIEKKINHNIRFFYYHFWVLERLRYFNLLPLTEHFIRKPRWKRIFNRYDYIFLTDPNQYYLLPYIEDKQIVFLLRDPNILLDSRNYKKERAIIEKADIILGISKNLCNYYLERYYGFVPEKVFYWPNTVDLNLWDYNKYRKLIKEKENPVVGLAGNINYINDLELLDYISDNHKHITFEIAGKIDLDRETEKTFKKIIDKPNVRYLGFIDYQIFPKVVINWDVGIVAAKPDIEYSKYLNNNKQYQYLALGKPFITYNLNGDYDEFDDMVFVVKNKEEFSRAIPRAIKKSKHKKSIEKGTKIARKHSADNRAQMFLNILRANK